MDDTRPLRTIHAIVRPPRQRHGPGLATTDLRDDELGGRMDPFIMVSLYDMAGPTFPPHPHAGFSVATYILPESPIGFVNHDTLGNRNRIAPGALHVTVAGSGVQHEEQPERSGSLARGFQIWIDHAAADRLLAPHALHLRANEVPVFKADGASVRVVLGTSNGIASPLATPTPVRLIDVTLERDCRLDQDLEPGEHAFVMVLEGTAQIAGREVDTGSVAITADDGGPLALSTRDRSARLVLFAGRPLRQPRVQHGPFVASDAEQVRGFLRAFEATRFGTLRPFAAQPDWQPNDGQSLG